LLPGHPALLLLQRQPGRQRELLEALENGGLHRGDERTVLDRDEAPCLRVAGAGGAGRETDHVLHVLARDLLVEEAAHMTGVANGGLEALKVGGGELART
jgi:hypothetical protein